jgi:hypothetical protein
LSQGWAWRARAWRAIIDPVVFRAIDVVAVPRLGSIVKILILSLAEIGANPLLNKKIHIYTQY